MRDVLHANAECCAKFRDELLNSERQRTVESSRDLYWSSSVSPRGTDTTYCKL